MTRVLLIAMAAGVGAACASSRPDEIRRPSHEIAGPFDYIPARWVDLPDSPFVARMGGAVHC